MRFLFLFLLFFTACSPQSYEDFRYEGEALARSIAQDLKRVHTKEDLEKISPRLRKKFQKLADLIISLRKFQEKQPLEGAYYSAYEAKANEELYSEMKRIYQIPGARQIMERAQTDALTRIQMNHL